MYSIVLMAAMLAVIAGMILTSRTSFPFMFAAVPAFFAIAAGVPLTDLAGSSLRGAVDISGTASLLFSLTWLILLASGEGFFDRLAFRLIQSFSKRDILYKRVIPFVTAALGILLGLTGSPAVVYTASIACLLPVYRRNGLEDSDLTLLVALAMGTSLAWPWSNKTLIIAAMANVPPVDLWMACLPMQCFGAGLLVAFCAAKMRKIPKTELLRMGESPAQVGQQLPRARDALLIVLLLFSMLMVVLKFKFSSFAIIACCLVVMAVDRLCGGGGPEGERWIAIKEAARPLIQTIIIGSFIGITQSIIVANPDLAGLISGFARGDAVLAAWVIGALLSFLLVLVPYQIIYVIIPALLVGAGATVDPIALCVPFVLMYSSTVSPSVPSTTLFDSFLNAPPLSHLKKNAPIVCSVHFVVVAIGFTTISWDNAGHPLL